MTTTATDAPARERNYLRYKWTAFAIGLVAGAASAFLGIGGGLIMVPALVWLCGVTQHQAVGTSLAVILPTALAAAVRYHHEAIERRLPGLDLAVIVCLSVGGVAGAYLGASLANALNARQLRGIFGLFVIAVGLWMVYRSLADGAPHGAPTVVDAAQGVRLFGVGVAVGVVSGLFGVGGGLVMVPALALFLGYSQHLAQGTSLAVIIPVSLSGGWVHFRRGNVVTPLAVFLSLGAVLGAWVVAGRVFAIPQDVLRGVFGCFLMFVGGSMAVGARRGAPLPAGSKGVGPR